MKKLICFTITLLLTVFSCNTVKANTDYQSFQEIEMVGDAKFLSKFTDEDYERLYSKLPRYKHIGWAKVYEHKDVKVKYKVETLFQFYNEGDTPIKYESNFKSEITEKRSLSSSGGISIKSAGKIKKFSSGLDASIKSDYSESSTFFYTQGWNVKFDVDPGTMVQIYIAGEGKITNGVAGKYILFRQIKKGGFEIFTITSQCYRMEKTKI